jgi:quinol monooxygenase YgiN
MRFRFAPLVLLIAGAFPCVAAEVPGSAAGPVYVVTHIDLTPNNTPAGVAVIKQFVAATLKEKSCTRFEILQQAGRPNHLTLVAVWKDQKSFDAHDGAPWTKQFREKIQPLIGSPWDERLHALVLP